MRAVQTQTLTMTPQLQQAIRLLQLSTLDLRQEIQLTIEKNPLLEIDESIANSNVDSLDEMAENERRANDSEIFDPFSDDASYQGADIDMSTSITKLPLLVSSLVKIVSHAQTTLAHAVTMTTQTMN